MLSKCTECGKEFDRDLSPSVVMCGDCFYSFLASVFPQIERRTCPVCDGEKGATIGGVWHDCTNCNGTGISR